jgi:hypothetical protein
VLLFWPEDVSLFWPEDVLLFWPEDVLLFWPEDVLLFSVLSTSCMQSAPAGCYYTLQIIVDFLIVK